MSTEPAAVRQHLDVALDCAQAFELFTRGIDRWWPFRDHSCAGEDARTVHFEERVGGAVTEIARDGTRHPWGTLTAWQPPTSFSMSWHPAQPPEHATRLAVRFEATVTGCRIELEHDGWSARGADAQGVRDGYQAGWGRVLGLFAAAASGTEKSP